MLLKRLQIENENENDQGYRDRAYRGTTRETDSEDIISATNERGRSPAQVPFLFVSKLHDLLKDCDDDPDGKGTIVSWLCHGKAFRVHKRNDFVETILPVYFKQTKYKSFQRQRKCFDLVPCLVRSVVTFYDVDYFLTAILSLINNHATSYSEPMGL